MNTDLITEDWQMAMNGFLIGSGTPYEIRQISGLLDLPEIRSQDQATLLRDGLVPGEDFLGGRIFTVSLDVVEQPGQSLSEMLHDLTTAWRSTRDEQEIAIRVPGVARGDAIIVHGRLRRRSNTIGLEYYYGIAEVDLEFYCTDPRLYSAVERSVTIQVEEAIQDGLTFNALAPFSFGGVTLDNTVQIEAGGNTRSPLIIDIAGQITIPAVRDLATGHRLKLNTVIADGDFYRLDSDLRTVRLNGSASRYYELDRTSRWFEAEPGVTEVAVTAANIGQNASVTIRWRDAWV